MSNIAEKIYQEVRQLPEQLAREVYDFLRFVKGTESIFPLRSSQLPPRRIGKRFSTGTAAPSTMMHSR